MDCIVRFLHPQPSAGSRWSISVLDCSGISLLQVQRKDTETGWPDFTRLAMRNSVGDVQQIELQASERSQTELILRPYIPLMPRPNRQYWKIPPLIFQTWKDGEKSPEMQQAQQTFLSQNGYIYQHFTDQQCYDFLEAEFGPHVRDAYAVLVPGAYRADLWRYCVLYKFGGIYADIKTTLFRNLDEILRPEDELVLVRDVPSQCILNGFLACKPRHPLMKLAVEMALDRIFQRSYGVDPLDITGPHLLGRAFCRWMNCPEDTMTLTAGYTSTMQFLARSDDKLYIISPEGERLMQKEYESYYQKDMDVRVHYPQLWAHRAVYKDQPPWNSPPKN